MAVCRLDQIDDFTFEIGLVKRNRNPEIPGKLLAARLNFLQRRRAIDMRFADTEEIQIRSIQDHNFGGHRGSPSLIMVPDTQSTRGPLNRGSDQAGEKALTS